MSQHIKRMAYQSPSGINKHVGKIQREIHIAENWYHAGDQVAAMKFTVGGTAKFLESREGSERQ